MFMNVMLGMVYLLCDINLDSYQQEYFNVMWFVFDNFMDFINNILDVFKIEVGEVVFDLKLFDLYGLFSGLYQFW